MNDDTFCDAGALEETMELFLRSGFHDVSVDDVVRCTGLTRHAIYGRFGSKSGLLATAVRHFRSQLEALVEDVLAGPGTVNTRLEALFELQPQGTRRAESRLGCVAVRLSSELCHSHPALSDDLVELVDRLEKRLAAVVREGRQRGEVGSGRRPEVLGRMLANAFLLPMVLSPDATCPPSAWIDLLEIDRGAVATRPR